jgi:O-antigen ligase
MLHRICDRVLSGGLKALIVFTPLAFGTVEPWSIALMEWGIVTLALVFLLSRAYPGGAAVPFPSPPARRPMGILAVPIGLFLLLCGFQTVPLPMRWLGTLSPGSARLYESVDFATWEKTDAGLQDARTERHDPLLGLQPGGRRPVSVNPGATGRRTLLLATLVVLFFVVAAWADETRAVSILRWGILVAFLVSVFGLVQLLTWNGKIYWVRNVPSGSGTSPTAFGPFVNHNHFAGYVEMIIPVALSLVFWLVARRRISPGSRGLPSNVESRVAALFEELGEEPGRLGKVLLTLFATVILIVSLFISLSRGGILSAIVSGTVLLALLCRRTASRNLRWSMALALPAVVVALIGFIGSGTVIKQLQTYGSLSSETSFQLRAIIWRRVVQELPSYAWLGSGLGTFEDSFGPLTPAGSARRWDRAHNDYLQLLWETGAVGAGLFLVGAALFAKKYWWPALRDYRQPIDIFRVGIAVGLMSIALHSAVDFSLQIGADAFLCALLAGLLVALHPGASLEATGPRELRSLGTPRAE